MLGYSMYSVNVNSCCFWISKWWDVDLYMKLVSGKENINKHSYLIYLTLSFWYFNLCLFGKHINTHHCQFFEPHCPSFASVRKKSSLYGGEHVMVRVPQHLCSAEGSCGLCVSALTSSSPSVADLATHFIKPRH